MCDVLDMSFAGWFESNMAELDVTSHEGLFAHRVREHHMAPL